MRILAVETSCDDPSSRFVATNHYGASPNKFCKAKLARARSGNF